MCFNVVTSLPNVVACVHYLLPLLMTADNAFVGAAQVRVHAAVGRHQVGHLALMVAT
jgi:hypothetical protein